MARIPNPFDIRGFLSHSQDTLPRPEPPGPPPGELDGLCPIVCRDRGWMIPNREQCIALWDHFHMPGHIREHSRLVAHVAHELARMAADKGLPVEPDAVLASGLLHDLAKDYTILHGGHHAQLGGVWTLVHTGNPLIAQGVTHHVYWPWNVDLDLYFLPLAVIYADKRVRHTDLVTLEDRYADLFDRYGMRNEYIYGRIAMSAQQCVKIEMALSRTLELDLNAYTFDSRGLVL